MYYGSTYACSSSLLGDNEWKCLHSFHGVHILLLESELNIEKGLFYKLQVSRITHAFHSHQKSRILLQFIYPFYCLAILNT
jgi:hypothetical protein